jgi:hypothetical protein
MALRPILTPQGAPDLKDGRDRPIGIVLRQWLQAHLTNHGQALTQLGLGHVIAVRPYGTTVTPDLSQGAIQKVTVTNSSAVTIAAPVKPTGLATWQLVIVNASGGALGTVTFDSTIQQTGFSGPANGHRTSATFLLDGTQHVQLTPWVTV